MQRHPVEPLVALFCQLRSGTEGEIRKSFLAFFAIITFYYKKNYQYTRDSVCTIVVTAVEFLSVSGKIQ